MVRKGYGVIYRGSGAQYGERSLEWWNALEEKAQGQRIGMWVNGKEKASLPSDFKKR